MPMPQARKIGTVVLESLVAELQGVRCLELEEVAPQRKGMAVTRSAGSPMMSFDEVAQAVTAHATRAAEKLRHHVLVAGQLLSYEPVFPDRTTPLGITDSSPEADVGRQIRSRASGTALRQEGVERRSIGERLRIHQSRCHARRPDRGRQSPSIAL